MSVEPNKYARIDGVTEQECYERWEGIKWQSNNDGSDRGVCESDYDFDEWAAEHEGDDEDE